MVHVVHVCFEPPDPPDFRPPPSSATSSRPLLTSTRLAALPLLAAPLLCSPPAGAPFAFRARALSSSAAPPFGSLLAPSPSACLLSSQPNPRRSGSAPGPKILSRSLPSMWLIFHPPSWPPLSVPPMKIVSISDPPSKPAKSPPPTMFPAQPLVVEIHQWCLEASLEIMYLFHSLPGCAVSQVYSTDGDLLANVCYSLGSDAANASIDLHTTLRMKPCIFYCLQITSSRGVVFLDQAGSSCYSELQMEDIFKEFTCIGYGNPHSQRDISSVTSDIANTHHHVLEFYIASTEDYSCILMSGATAALVLVTDSCCSIRVWWCLLVAHPPTPPVPPDPPDSKPIYLSGFIWFTLWNDWELTGFCLIARLIPRIIFPSFMLPFNEAARLMFSSHLPLYEDSLPLYEDVTRLLFEVPLPLYEDVTRSQFEISLPLYEDVTRSRFEVSLPLYEDVTIPWTWKLLDFCSLLASVTKFISPLDSPFALNGWYTRSVIKGSFIAILEIEICALAAVLFSGIRFSAQGFILLNNSIVDEIRGLLRDFKMFKCFVVTIFLSFVVFHIVFSALYAFMAMYYVNTYSYGD